MHLVDAVFLALAGTAALLVASGLSLRPDRARAAMARSLFGLAHPRARVSILERFVRGAGHPRSR